MSGRVALDKLQQFCYADGKEAEGWLSVTGVAGGMDATLLDASSFLLFCTSKKAFPGFDEELLLLFSAASRILFISEEARALLSMLVPSAPATGPPLPLFLFPSVCV